MFLSDKKYTELQMEICQTHGVPVRNANAFYRLVYSESMQKFGVIRTPYRGYFTYPQEVKLQDGGIIGADYVHEVDDEGYTYLVKFESEWDDFVPVKVDYKLED